jgi:hypothetical protein
MAFCFWALKWNQVLRPAVFFSFLASAYVLGGVYLLSLEVEKRFAAVSRDSGWIGLLAKNFTITLHPDDALYGLPAFAFLLVLSARFLRR